MLTVEIIRTDVWLDFALSDSEELAKITLGKSMLAIDIFGLDLASSWEL